VNWSLYGSWLVRYSVRQSANTNKALNPSARDIFHPNNTYGLQLHCNSQRIGMPKIVRFRLQLRHFILYLIKFLLADLFLHIGPDINPSFLPYSPDQTTYSWATMTLFRRIAVLRGQMRRRQSSHATVSMTIARLTHSVWSQEPCCGVLFSHTVSPSH
jgi:hypothetical protein